MRGILGVGQTEGWLRDGSATGKDSKIEATNCVTRKTDRSPVTQGDQSASNFLRPYYNPFNDDRREWTHRAKRSFLGLSTLVSQVARLLALITAVVISAAIIQLMISLAPSC